jgi:hypothetical protein
MHVCAFFIIHYSHTAYLNHGEVYTGSRPLSNPELRLVVVPPIIRPGLFATYISYSFLHSSPYLSLSC